MAGEGSSERQKTWLVKLGDKKPFTMGGEAMTRAEALDTARCIWATTDPATISVEPAIKKDAT